MKKFIRSSLLAFTLITAIVMNGCNAFENFVFGLPISFVITATDNPPITNPSGSISFCLDTVDTYQDYADKLNSVTFVEAYAVTIFISSGDEGIQGDIQLRLFAGSSPVGIPLFTEIIPNGKPADYFSPNAYKLQLTQQEIDDVNASLANDNTCFYADYQITVNPGSATPPYTVTVKIDALYNIDSDL